MVAAHHIELDQKVAIKFLLADVAQHADAAERFRREARAVAQIHSDHVVRVLDVGTLPDDIPFMVMEHLEGHDLGQRMTSNHAFAIEEAVGYTLEAIDAIGRAHQAGIVHRDLKPANLFLAKRPDGSLRIKVLDFGISKSLVDTSPGKMRLTSTTTLIGSPLYMSPEQMQSPRDVDARADIWSLGAILFEMLAARPPYQASTLPQLCQELMTADPPRLRKFRPEAPEALEEAIARCLVRDLDQRWPDVAGLAAALAPFAPQHRGIRPESYPESLSLSDSTAARISNPVSSGSSGTLEPWGRSRDRNVPTKKAFLVLVLLVVTGGIAALLFSWPSKPAGGGAPGQELPSNAPLPSVNAAAAAHPRPHVGQVEASEAETTPDPSSSGVGTEATPTKEHGTIPPRAPHVPRAPRHPPGRPHVPAPPAHSVISATPSTISSGLSDFGGRR